VRAREKFFPCLPKKNVVFLGPENSKNFLEQRKQFLDCFSSTNKERFNQTFLKFGRKIYIPPFYFSQYKKEVAIMAKVSDEGKLWAFLAYFLSIVGFVLVLALKKNNKFAMYHAKQSLVLFIASIILYVLAMILTPILLFFVFYLFWIIYLLIFILWIIGIINAVSGKMKPLPIIGGFAEKFKF
jgi:uncharacterized membrane protein